DVGRDGCQRLASNGDAPGRKAELFDKAMGISRPAGKIDDFAHRRSRSGERADHVGTEARPMLFSGDHDGNLAVAEALHQFIGSDIGGNVDDGIVDALAVEGAGGRGALNAGGFAVDGDAHGVLAGLEGMWISLGRPPTPAQRFKDGMARAYEARIDATRACDELNNWSWTSPRSLLMRGIKGCVHAPTLRVSTRPTGHPARGRYALRQVSWLA